MTTYVRGAVDETEEPLVLADILRDAKLVWEEQIRPVDDGLVHLKKSKIVRKRLLKQREKMLTPCTAAASEHMMTR